MKQINESCPRTLMLLCVMHSVQFLPREAMRKRGLCCRPVSVRPSRPSRWCIVSTRLKIIVKLISRPGSPIILVFFDFERRYLIPREPLQQRRKLHGVGKFCNFRQKSPFISETVRDRRMVVRLIGSHRWRIDVYRFR